MSENYDYMLDAPEDTPSCPRCGRALITLLHGNKGVCIDPECTEEDDA